MSSTENSSRVGALAAFQKSRFEVLDRVVCKYDAGGGAGVVDERSWVPGKIQEIDKKGKGGASKYMVKLDPPFNEVISISVDVHS